MGARAAKLEELKLLPGFYTEETPASSVGRWKDGNMVRFYKGKPQKIGGWERDSLTFDTGSTSIIGHVRAVKDWYALDKEPFTAIGTECKLYIITRGVVYDITPLRKASSAINPFTTVGASAIVTVVDALHGAEDGDHVRFQGATAVGGIVIDGQYEVLAVLNENTYTIQHTSAAATGATGGGTVQAQYDISCGFKDDGEILRGYGTGNYGTGPYGTARADSTFVGQARVWSLEKFGEDLLASPRGGTIYWWDRSLGPSSRAVVVPTAPNAIERLMISPDEKYVLALGCTEVSGDNQDLMLVRWCDTDDFTEWEPKEENFAGSRRLTFGSRLVTGVTGSSQMLVLSDEALYVCHFVDVPNIFDFDHKGSVKVMGPNAAVQVAGTVYIMAKEDFYIFDGTLRLMSCDVLNYVTENRNGDQPSKVFGWDNSDWNEIWWHYPSSDSRFDENDRTVIFNYAENCWYYNTIAREAGHDRSQIFSRPYAFFEGKLYLHESGVDDHRTELPSFIESYDVQISDGDFLMLVTHAVPDFRRVVGTVKLTLEGRDYPQSKRVSGSYPVTIKASTEWLSPRLRAGQISLKLATENYGDDWRMGRLLFKAIPHGRRP
jgi:hypothetical protein